MQRMMFLYAFTLVCVLPGLVTGQLFDLSSLRWTLRNQNGSIVVPGSLPSQVHLDLLKAAVIAEPLLGANDFTQRWITSDRWTYTADLSPFTSKLWSSTSKTLLIFYGIDTIANITFAGQPIAWVNNQFRQYIFDVSHILSSPSGGGNLNNLTVAFESAAVYGRNVSSRPDVEFFPAGLQVFEYPDGHPFVRKTASDFGWDWGPAFVPSGIFKPSFLLSLSSNPSARGASSTANSPITFSPTIFIEEKSIEIHKAGQRPSLSPDQNADWVVNVTLILRSAAAEARPSLSIYIPDLRFASGQARVAAIPGDSGRSTLVTASFTVPNGLPQLWYPRNLGDPKRYNITVTLHTPSTRSGSLSFKTTTGFRTIVLIQEPYPQSDIVRRGITPGDQFHFEINGKTFYSLGTNIIPFDPFYARMTSEQVRWVIESAVRGGQNMLRVWGGGIYQPSEAITGGYSFYEACDELGILAWSELIFSDNLYPINSFLLESIAPEVQQNVRRTNRHPSNAQWAGGNEIEGIVETVNTTLANGTHYLSEFVKLFQNFLHDIVLSETTSLAYTDCSTTSGYLSLDPYVLRFRNGTSGHIYGNGERYNYDASQAFNYSTYPVSRFMNEFGFHSMPSFYSWEEVLESPTDFSFNSTIVASRDHHPPAGGLAWPNPNSVQGQAQMTSAVELWLPAPGTSDANQTFAQWCWSTQVFQSLNMVSEIAWYRRGAGLGENNLGALVWQLNDIWQGVSWSSIEYSGRWKVLQYGMASAFKPVVIYPFWTPTNQSLELLVISDRWETVHSSAQLTWFDWHGQTISSSKHTFSVPTLNNSQILAATGLDNILPKGRNATDVWLLLNVTSETDLGTVTNEQYFTPVALSRAALVDPVIRLTHQGDFTFTLSARGGVGVFTWMDHPLGTVGVFVDAKTGEPSNGFYLIPGQDRTLRFELNSALSKVKHPVIEDFVVRSLWNNTHL